MDPNEALRQIRELVGVVEHTDDVAPETAKELAELFDGLDEWLSKGGFFPKAWDLPRHRAWLAER